MFLSVVFLFFFSSCRLELAVPALRNLFHEGQTLQLRRQRQYILLLLYQANLPSECILRPLRFRLYFSQLCQPNLRQEAIVLRRCSTGFLIEESPLYVLLNHIVQKSHKRNKRLHQRRMMFQENSAYRSVSPETTTKTILAVLGEFS